MFREFESLELITKRLVISPFKESDLEAVYAMHSIDTVNRYLPYNTWKTWQDAEDWLQLMRQRRVDQEAQIFTLKNKDTGKLVGTSLVFGPNKSPQDLNFGYVLAPANWGKGYATEAMQVLVERLLSMPEIPQLSATVEEGNDASTAVLLKLEFVDVGAGVDADGAAIKRFKRIAN